MLLAEFINAVSTVLGVRAEKLSLETAYGEIEEWDSIAHIRLVMEMAKRYGVEIPLNEVAEIRTLWDFWWRGHGKPTMKAIAVDLDNTLWEGVVSEDGANGIRAKKDFIAELKALKERGILLVALSKNDIADARAGLKAIEGIGEEDFVALGVDWNRKSDNLKRIANELNLGLEAFVFVDDNPAEREAMRAEAPEVTVAEFPPRLSTYFAKRELTEEDRRKTELYREEASRRAALNAKREIECTVDIHPIKKEEVSRVAQLSQKANRFNFRTIRRSEAEVESWLKDGATLVMKCADEFGDMGLVGFVHARVDGETAQIEDFVLSCRVMGRGFEQKLKAAMNANLKARGVKKLKAEYLPSGKNEAAKNLYALEERL